MTGERGVGKELVAQAIHTRSPRGERAFVPVNCAGLPEPLLESELFGHVRGSFTGAYRDKPGKLELAHEDTVFLDEVGEMTLRMQGLLLRFFETGEIQKVGADRVIGTVNVRVIAATSPNLTDLIAQGQFREDLFYRLNAIHLHVPPLRERRDDVQVLLPYSLRVYSQRHGVPTPDLSPDALRLLTACDWPGTVREPKNVIERLVVRAWALAVAPEDLPAEITGRQRGEREKQPVPAASGGFRLRASAAPEPAAGSPPPPGSEPAPWPRPAAGLPGAAASPRTATPASARCPQG